MREGEAAGEPPTTVWGWPVRRWILLACGLHAVLGLLLYDPTLFTGGDNAGYMILGESLRSLEGYRDLHLPGAPVHTKYPPLYPALLAVLGWIGGLQLFKLASLALTTGAVALVGGLGRRWLGPRLGIAAALLVAVNPVLVSYAHWVLSEAPFVLLVLLSLYGFERAGQGDGLSPTEGGRGMAGAAGGPPGPAGSGGTSGGWWGVALAAAVGAFLTRTAGLPLLAAAVLHPALERRWRRAAGALAASVAAAGGWALFQRLGAPEQAGYLSELLMIDPYDPAAGTVGAAGLLGRTAQNFWQYVSQVLPQSVTGARGDAGVVTAAAGLVLAGLAAAGWLRRSVERLGTAELFLLLYLGLVCAWPSVWTDRRFLLPALPLLLIYGLEGARLAGGAAVGREASGGAGIARAGAPALLSVTVLVPGLVDAGRSGPDRLRCLAGWRSGSPCVPPAYVSFYAAAEWVREHVPEDAVVVNRKPRLFYWISGRRGDLYPFSSEPDVVLAGLEETGADYVVVDAISGTTARYLVPAVQAHPSRFLVEHREGPPPTWVLRFRRDTGTARAPAGTGAGRLAAAAPHGGGRADAGGGAGAGP